MAYATRATVTARGYRHNACACACAICMCAYAVCMCCVHVLCACAVCMCCVHVLCACAVCMCCVHVLCACAVCSSCELCSPLSIASKLPKAASRSLKAAREFSTNDLLLHATTSPDVYKPITSCLQKAQLARGQWKTDRSVSGIHFLIS